MAEIFGTTSLEFNIAVRTEFLEHGGKAWIESEGELNRVALFFSDYSAASLERVVKVPRQSAVAHQKARNEYAILQFLGRTKSRCPLEIPKPLRKSEDPLYIVLTGILGQVLGDSSTLTPYERYRIAGSLTHVALWERSLDIEDFLEQVTPGQDRSRDWHSLLANLDDFDDSDYPQLSAAAAEIRALRDRYLPEKPRTEDSQIIHGDARPSNIVLRGRHGRRRARGLIDWGNVGVGTLAEELRYVYDLGAAGVAGCNEVLSQRGIKPVRAEELRFWRMGRTVVSMIHQLRNGIEPEEYMDTKIVLEYGYPNVDWAELPPIERPRTWHFHNSGPGFSRTISC